MANIRDHDSPEVDGVRLIRKEYFRQYRFSVGMFFGLALAARRTRTVFNPLRPVWRARVGLSPADLCHGRWQRLLTAPLVSDGVEHFWSAIALTVSSGVLAERRWGTRRTIQVFWGVHVLTMLIEAGIVHLLSTRQAARWQRLLDVRDVGPSAGYFGLLGHLSAHLPAPWHALSGLGTTGILLAILWRPQVPGTNWDLRLLADIAHLIAFPLGWLFGLVKR